MTDPISIEFLKALKRTSFFTVADFFRMILPSIDAVVETNDSVRFDVKNVRLLQCEL